MQLIVCDGCRRHVRVGEVHCPFCGVLSATARGAIEVVPTARPRSRRAWWLGAVLVAATAGCGADATEEATTQEEPGTGGEPTSGGESGGTADLERTGGQEPAADAGPQSGPPREPGDPGGVIALYGVAPPPEE
ncbi:MAG: hypothetical protein IT460_00285 [Planctomycetes bacterium]|nr:hypothetical protein [Planctomycetota bacterium]